MYASHTHKVFQVSEAHADKGTSGAFSGSLREFPSTLKKLLCNPTFVFVSLAGTMEGKASKICQLVLCRETVATTVCCIYSFVMVLFCGWAIVNLS